MGSSTTNLADDEAESTSQPHLITKASKRNRLKEVVSRTKTKFTKTAAESPQHDDDVEEFLAAGRNSSSTGRPSTSDSFTSGRPRSASSLSKGTARARGLSVQFTNQPPVIIGEGGDEAQAPPIEISRIAARARARSLSPALTTRDSGTPVRNIPEAHDLRSAHGTINLRSKFDGQQRQQRQQQLFPEGDDDTKVLQ
ncbi:hypothetical protein DV735_g5379, partial [Chaetothyriales sp. CBS 134920]